MEMPSGMGAGSGMVGPSNRSAGGQSPAGMSGGSRSLGGMNMSSMESTVDKWFKILLN